MVHTFSLCRGLKLNVIVSLKIKLAYYDVTVKLVSHCTPEDSPQITTRYEAHEKLAQAQPPKPLFNFIYYKPGYMSRV